MQYVLITVSGGIVDEVTFFYDKNKAIKALGLFVRTMDPEDQDAAVYDEEGMVLNSKPFLYEG